MVFGVKSVLWSAAALVLLLSMGVPLLNVLTVTLMMVPYVVLYTTLSKKAFVLHLLPVWGIGYLIMGLPALIVGLFFLIPGIVMGHLYRRDRPVRVVFTAVIVTIVGQILLELLLFNLIMNVSLIDELGNTIRTMTEQLRAQGMLSEAWTSELTDLTVRTTVQSIPQVLLMMGFLYTAVTQYIARRVLGRMGVSVKGFPPAKDWMLPRIMVLYYLVVTIIQLMVSKDSGSFLAVAVINLLPLLQFAFKMQAIGFFFFLADQRKWPRAVPLLMAIPVLLLSPLSLIGVLDVAFPIRKSFRKT
ncbi:DUF2232 domain-containing protein [Paenibacillus beijingensis]|uniref:DUF2232 domain-containing protein n=1 Tax=Paenibacillus beijingensis TaxID=1126833 RepID=UPI000AFC2993|nr:DUF2232 domain-containing protein [Paenibacillus beijingensis]